LTCIRLRKKGTPCKAIEKELKKKTPALLLPSLSLPRLFPPHSSHKKNIPVLAIASLILATSSSHHGVSGQIIFIPTMTRSNFPNPLKSVSSLSYYQTCRCHGPLPPRGGTADDLVKPTASPPPRIKRRRCCGTCRASSHQTSLSGWQSHHRCVRGGGDDEDNGGGCDE
jgi:hypothetical protein